MNHIDFDNLNDITFSTLFAIPDYQRDYSWGTAEVETLLEDTRDLLHKNGADGNYKHFCGSIVVIRFDPTVSKNTQGAFATKKLKNFSKVNVIDGQQRLSTLSLLLIAIKDRLKGTDFTVSKFEDMIDTGMKDDNGDFVPVLNFADLNTQNCYRHFLYGKDITTLQIALERRTCLGHTSYAASSLTRPARTPTMLRPRWIALSSRSATT